MYLKFCRKEKFYQDVLNGDLYSNTAEWFRKKEIESGERGQGDRFELVLPFLSEKITLYDYETGNHFMDFYNANVHLRINDDDKLPIVCFVGIPLCDMNMLEYDENHALFSFPFTDKEYDEIENKFGEYCILINARELENKITTYCNANNCEFIFDRIIYCDENSFERMKAFASISPTRALFKNKDLAYQREYRLVLPVDVLEDNYIRIGKLKNAKCLNSSEIKNMVIRIDYTAKHPE